ncbi:alpha/beta fold hydrolase [Bradyrhizobium sp. BR13661]|nr:alpha/beta fold hydrolase [Bradyrhizobium sp. BR13661]MDH6264206.1 medium-chain acyl-[acyl-carrier-protein] hydrolase [Bradyrhizobium sp. BR13661]
MQDHISSLNIAPMHSPWIEFRPNRPDAQARVLCFPYAGGSAQVYHALARGMPENVELGAVQLPGRWDRRREPLLTRLSDASRNLADEIARLSPKPYVLFGYSLGGLIAFEAARIVARDPELRQPRALIVAAAEAPAGTPGRPQLHALPDAEFIKKQMDRYPGGISPAVLAEPDLMEMLLPIIKADMQMFETYRYTPETPLACPIYAMAGEQDRLCTPSAMAGWERETSGSFFTETVAGNHFFINNAADRMRATILRALA